MEKEQTRSEAVKEILTDSLQLQLTGAGFLAQRFAQEADELDKKLTQAKLEIAEAIKLFKKKPEQTDES